VTDGSSLDCVTGTGAAVATDCDDSAAGTYPTAPEVVADGIDQDCDTVDSCYTDTDGDAYGTAVVIDGSSLDCVTGTGASVATDCDDASSAVHPGATADLDCDDGDTTAYPSATDVTGSGVDEDCDGTEICYVDADGDGYRPDATATVTSADGDCADLGEALSSALTGDCDDTSTAFNPGAAEADCTDPND
jgi:hypothetical protein